MKDKNILIICITAIICIAILSATILLTNQTNTNNNTTENDTINITLNDTQNNTTETTKTSTTKKSSKNNNKSSEREYGDYIDDEWVSMSEKEYAERYPALYHEEALQEGKYDKYHPEFYEVDRENGRI